MLFGKWRHICILCSYLLLIAGTKIFTEAGVLPLTLIQKSTTDFNGSQDQQQTSTIAGTIAHRFAGYIEYQPNGTIILRSSSLENTTNLQNLMLFKTILKAIKLAAPFQDNQMATNTKFNIKIYGDGIEHKFPPFLERIIQRIQTYFSVYRYTDTSNPERQETTTGNTQTEHNYLTTTAIGVGDVGGVGDIGDIGDAPSNVDNVYLNYVDDFENTTAFIDNGTTASETGNSDYPEFIEIKANNDFVTITQD